MRLRHTIDQGNLIKLLGMRCNKFVLIMETLFLDGGPQSVRYGGSLHDGSGQLDDANSQGVADSEIFVMVMTQQNLRIK